MPYCSDIQSKQRPRAEVEKCSVTDNAWRYEEELFRSRLNKKMCKQGGDVEHGIKMRLFPCEITNGLQHFVHTGATGIIQLKSILLVCVLSFAAAITQTSASTQSATCRFWVDKAVELACWILHSHGL